jgi:hypothetical protein
VARKENVSAASIPHTLQPVVNFTNILLSADFLAPKILNLNFSTENLLKKLLVKLTPAVNDKKKNFL